MEQKKEYAPEYAIWEKKTKNGDTYLNLKTLDGKWVTFFRNKQKKSDKAPDWREAPKKDAAPKDGNDYKFNSNVDSEEIPF